ncbi:hypothetical protein HK097_005265 [Rhizophlyctis rosea]|uniref:Uncharacterized protein n=1 Tax=Rhizophlyctis rosea TaxID=64517 RepID=A0AAD5X5L4_9FUNG|nr:hypothetical protein HK097_005265 [Rhizophlyctis rosea]
MSFRPSSLEAYSIVSNDRRNRSRSRSPMARSYDSGSRPTRPSMLSVQRPPSESDRSSMMDRSSLLGVPSIIYGDQPGSVVESQRLNFNPLPDAQSISGVSINKFPHLNATDVRKWKRVLQVIAAVLSCLFAAGIVFGYAAIKSVLKAEGAYRDYCSPEGGVDPETCIELRLNFMFTIAALSTNIAALPVGAILDYYGPRACGLIASALLTIGALLMAYNAAIPIDGLLYGYLFLALGGSFIFISSFQLSNAFPRHSGLVLAILTGAFDASSALFLLYRVHYESTEGSLSLRHFFLGYLAVPIAIALFQIFLLPAESYKTVGELLEEVDKPPSVNEQTPLLVESAQEQRQRRASVVSALGVEKQAKREEKKHEKSGVWGVMHQHTAWEQIKSGWFIPLAVFNIVQMLRNNFFMATIRPQYEYIFHSPTAAAEINNFFDITLPIGGILSIPFIGYILDHTSTFSILCILVTSGTLIGSLQIVPNILAAKIGVVLFVLNRPFYYTAISDYCAKVFGYTTFGTVYGAIICSAGVFNLVQSGIDYLVQTGFEGNPIPVNLALLGSGLVLGIAMLGYVGAQVRKIKRDRESLDALLTASAVVP